MWKSFVELYRFRALIHVLVARDLKARYRGSVLGFLWSLLNPCLLMLVYWLVFSVYMRFDMANYHVFLFCGLLPWVWFSSGLLEGCNSIIAGGSLVKKVLFPAEILPLVVLISYLIHFLLAIPILLMFMALAGIWPGWNILGLPIVMAVQFIFSFGLLLLLSALSVRYRDIQQILVNFVTLWFFVSPIIYPITGLPAGAKKYMILMNMNPMLHIIVGYQRVFLQWMDVGGGVTPNNLPLPWIGLLGVTGFSCILLYVSYSIFNKLKASFSEEI